ncbi:MAG: long-chain-acyl-CoA synthetase [Gammaproteobacteria bacterium]|nr:long-chain-acyl-CoA synthetase [Gammaproteobacteria bacterium]MYF37573.1 long-chain-acyl-CoA synthetase [Gammaproteobacteria bacterium]
MSVSDFFSVIKDVPTLLALKKGLKPRPGHTKDSVGLQFSETAKTYGAQTAIVFEGETVSWGECNKIANRYAHALQDAGVSRGDAVSIVMQNRIEFIALVVAINKLGAIAGLINTNLRAAPLQHCIVTTNSKVCVFGTELSNAIEEVRDSVNLTRKQLLAIPDRDKNTPEWASDLHQISAEQSTDDPSSQFESTLAETAFYVFTSGTTGLPKAAVVSNRRFLQLGRLATIAGLRCRVGDRIYLCLPLYHSTGLVVGFSAALCSGAAMFIRRRFSARNFLKDIREHHVTHMIYVGELLRYLHNLPRTREDADNPLHTIMGNGLRPDIWDDFKQRFGIERITEFYSASEGNFAFANIMNKDRTVGLTAAKVALVKYDVENDEIVKDSNGYCIEVAPGEPGLCLGEINPNAKFEGYTDPEATNKKILKNVFEDGDQWFNSGDLLKTIDVGFALGYTHFQFVDRIGDTYRWRSENVSTNEVAEILNGFEQVAVSNVYGVSVPGTEGRAGMVAISLNEDVDEFDVRTFSKYVNQNLPHFARPVFVRIQTNVETTSTFKVVKKELRADGYDLDKVADPVYVLKKGSVTYEPLDQEFLVAIQQGNAKF